MYKTLPDSLTARIGSMLNISWDYRFPICLIISMEMTKSRSARRSYSLYAENTARTILEGLLSYKCGHWLLEVTSLIWDLTVLQYC